ncbi:MAG: hypothetical protein IKY83_06205 [Proteobacteria bacterium]|nr:hypothetical protein [Pseudomonadota bacterium]
MRLSLFCGVFCSLLLAGCATELVGEKSDLTKMEFPTGMAIHPNGRYAYVVGSNFDLDYRSTDGGAIYVLDLERNEILPTSKRMGSFGTNIVLSADGRHGYTVTRSDDALVWFEISEDGSSIRCPKEKSDSPSLLECRVILDDNPTFVSVTRSYRERQTINSGGSFDTERVPFDLLMVAQLRNARISAVTAREENGEMKFSHASASYLSSASEIEWIGGERFAVTGRAAASLVIASPAIADDGSVKGVYADAFVTVPNGYGAYTGRGMTKDPTGTTLFLINQYPNSLIKFNITGLLKDSASTDMIHAMDMMMLPSNMSKVAWIGSADAGVLYLTSVSDNAIYIVDPVNMEILSKFTVGDGPYELIKDGESLYVINFLANHIEKYDVSDAMHPVLKTVYPASQTENAP